MVLLMQGACAVGRGADAGGAYSVAIGRLATRTTNGYGTAVGANTDTTADFATALGFNAQATASGSVALGASNCSFSTVTSNYNYT